MTVLVRMLEAVVITLREGIEAALVVGIVLAYLKRSGGAAMARYVFWGLGAAIAASVGGAVVITRWGLDPENEIWEGSLMLVAAVLVGSLVIWMWRAGRRVKQSTEARIGKLIEAQGQGVGTGVGLFAFTFFMVLREGIETVLFLGALSGTIGANPFYNALGGGTGLLLALLFGALLVQGSLRIDLRRFFQVTGIILLLLVVKLIANGLHEFIEAGLLPSTPALLAVIGLLTRESTAVVLLALLIAGPAIVLLQASLRGEETALPEEATAAERRKRLAEIRASRLWTRWAGATGVGLSVLLLLSLGAVARGYDPTPTPLALSAPLLRIPLAEIGEAPMRKYTVSVDGVSVRFFVVRGKGDQLAIALDACAICPLKGYHLVGDQVVCRNCDAPISFETIGVPGGCNPIPLKARIEDGSILIRAEDLAEGKARFARGA